MAQPKALTQIQVDVLRWIERGCPDGVMGGYNHRISAAALRSRGLVRTQGRGPTWTAVITEDGQNLLAELASPRPPTLRQPNVSLTQQLIDELIAAGGSLAFEQPRWPQRGSGVVDHVQRARAAHTHRKVPAGKWLNVERLSHDEVKIELRRPPDGWPRIDGPVPVPLRLTSTHPVVRDLKAAANRHEVSRSQLGRALRLVQGLVDEAERRGLTVRTAPNATDNYGHDHWTGPNQGHVIISDADTATAIRVWEIGLPSRAYWEHNHRSSPWGAPEPARTVRLSDYEKDATGRLCIEIVSPTFDSIRPSRWSDSRSLSLRPPDGPRSWESLARYTSAMVTFKGDDGTWSCETRDRLGGGTFGDVYRGESADGLPVAVKVIAPFGGPNGPRLRQREVDILRRVQALGSNRLIRLYDLAMVDDKLHLVLELADSNLVLPPGGVPVDEAMDVTREIALALVDLHSLKIWHRDLKPANVLRIGERLVISDFGMARDDELGTQSVTFLGGGTPRYMAPELADGASPNPASDLYALGVIAFEALAGIPPYAGQDGRRPARSGSPKAMLQNTPVALRDLVFNMLARDPRHRPSSAQAVADQLAAISLPIAPGQVALMTRIGQLDGQRSAMANADADASEGQQVLKELRSEAFASLSGLLDEAVRLIRPVDPRFRLVPPVIRAGSPLEPMDALRWALNGEYVRLHISLAHWPEPFTRNSRIVLGALVESGASSQRVIANLLYEYTEAGFRWNLYRFRDEENDSGSGPYGPPHGVSTSEFVDRRRDMRRRGKRSWKVEVDPLASDVIADLAGEASSASTER